MRYVLLLPLALALAACGERAADSTRDTAPAPPAWTPPPPASNRLMSAQVLWIDRDRDRVAIRLRLENTSTSPVQLHNLGDTLTGFRCVVDGHSYSAERQFRDHVCAAATLAEIPALTPVELDLHWRINPQRTSLYPCTIVVGNIFQNGRMDDISITVPPPVDTRRRDRDEKPEPPKTDAKPKDVSL